MGLLDDAMKMAAGAAPAVDTSSLATAALSMLSSQSGGISGLLQQFASKGLGNIVSSWVSTGPNLPISPEQLGSVLSSEQVQAVSQQSGMSPDAVHSGLAQLLPQLVDRLTPNGEVPQGDLMSKGLKLLEGSFLR